MGAGGGDGCGHTWKQIKALATSRYLSLPLATSRYLSLPLATSRYLLLPLATNDIDDQGELHQERVLDQHHLRVLWG